MTRRPQATKASRAHVMLHIKRQRNLGESMIGDWDQPKRWELIVTGLALIALALL